jgi:hypothetical protein
MASNGSNQALTPYNPAGAISADSRLTDMCFYVTVFYPNCRTMGVDLSACTVGNVITSISSTWVNLLKIGNSFITQYDTVVQELRNVNAYYDFDNQLDFEATKTEIAQYCTFDGMSVEDVKRLSELIIKLIDKYDMFLRRLKRPSSNQSERQVIDLTGKLAYAEATTKELQIANAQIKAQLDQAVQTTATKDADMMVQIRQFKDELQKRDRAKTQVDRAHAELGREHERLKCENDRLKSENARLVLAESKVTDLSTVLAAMKMSMRNQETVDKVSHDYSLLTKEVQMSREFEQVLQSKLREQKEKYKAKIRKIKAERKMYREHYLRSELKSSAAADINDSFTAI